MRKTITTLLIGGIICVLILGGCSKGNEPKVEPLTNRVYPPDRTETKGGEYVSIPLYFDNEVTLAAVNVPMLFPSSIMRFDSVSFVGSRVVNFGLNRASVNGDTLVVLALDDTAVVASGRGLLGTLHFWVHGNAPETTFVLNTFDYWRMPFNFFDINLEVVENAPAFKSGQVHIQTILPKPVVYGIKPD